MKLKQLACVLTMALAGGAAQAATVSDSFNGSSSLGFGGWFNAPLTNDDYLFLSPPLPLLGLGGTDNSSYTFTNVAAGSTIFGSFWYAASDSGASVSLSLLTPFNLPPTGTGFFSYALVATNNPGDGGSKADRQKDFSWTVVGAGDYTLTFARSSSAGSILKVDEFTATYVTAVPEPETYAMLLAGLGVMGAIARRRKAKAA